MAVRRLSTQAKLPQRAKNSPEVQGILKIDLSPDIAAKNDSIAVIERYGPEHGLPTGEVNVYRIDELGKELHLILSLPLVFPTFPCNRIQRMSWLNYRFEWAVETHYSNFR